VYAGRLAPEKNLPFLLKAFAGVYQAFPDSRLFLLGSGPERENLERLTKNLGVEKAVCFAGMVPYEKIPGYLAMCDAFVTASVSEVHPLSVIEAMAVGLPVLGIRSPGIEDTVEDGVTGYLTSEDLAAFTANMVRLVIGTGQRKHMGQAAHKVVDGYSIDHTTDLMISHYQNLIEIASHRRRVMRFPNRKTWQKRRP
jgi:glycosyltransferase involved in cell wall biosynthesis